MCLHSRACRGSDLKVILVLKGGCIPLYLVKEPSWDSYTKILTFYLNIFVTNAKLSKQKKKNSQPFFSQFLWVGRKRANICHLF